MSVFKPVAWFLSGALLGAGLSGCAVLHGSAASGTFLQPGQQRFRFANSFHKARAEAVAYRDPSEYEEYDRVAGSAQAEAILSVANGPQTSLIFPEYRLRSLTGSWTFNKQEAIRHWGSTHYIHIGPRAFAYALYRHQAADRQRGCVAFLRAWAPPPDDPWHRPSKAFFGYYCAPPKQRLTRQQAITVLRDIKTKTDNIPRIYYGQNLASDPGALATARGRPDTPFGNPRFPFQFSHYYRLSNGNKSFY
jgi:hypothetical protein